MSALITSIVELSQNFFDNPIKCNEYFAITNDYQKYCYKSNLLTRCSIGIVAKETMLVHDIFFNLIAGSIKLLAAGIKGLCAIPAGAFNAEIGHQRSVKESIVHFGFSAFYTADMIISLSNINDSYPQNLLKKIESVFAKFLQIPNKEVIIQYISDSKIEEELRKENQELARAAAAATAAEEEARAAAVVAQETAAGAVQDLEDLNQLVDNPKETGRELSSCEKIVNRVLYSNTQPYLEKIESIINSNQEREKPTYPKKLQKLINKPTNHFPSFLPPHKTVENWSFEDEGWNYEENLEPENYIENIDKPTNHFPSFLPSHKTVENWSFEDEDWNYEENLEPENYIENKETIQRNVITDKAKESVPISNPSTQRKTNLTEPFKEQPSIDVTITNVPKDTAKQTKPIHAKTQKTISSSKDQPRLSAKERDQRRKNYAQAHREKTRRSKKSNHKVEAL